MAFMFDDTKDKKSKKDWRSRLVRIRLRRKKKAARKNESKVYALLVAIDNYQPPVPALAGCVNDMLAMRKFLENRVPADRLNMEVLMNEQATRKNIVEMFERYLTQAKEEDVAFFYYSGHGSQERAHEAFRFLEPDMLNETFVCYDSRQFDGVDLADKEMGTLIDLVAQNNPHILVIVDCCNSGDISRAIDTVARSIPTSEVLRSLDSYILPSNIDRRALNIEETQGEQQITIPKARHVVLSAAQSFQLAKETRLGGVRRGVFTYSLLEVLQKNIGPISYADLMRQVNTLVLKRTSDQNPQIFAQVESDLDIPFMGGQIFGKGEYFLLTYNSNKGWEIDGGSVHGIMGPNIEGETTTLAVYHEGTPLEEMTVNSRLGEVKVETVDLATSIVRQEGKLRLNTNSSYRVRISNMPIDPMKVGIKALDERGREEKTNEGKELAQTVLSNMNNFYLKEEEDSGDVDYLLLAMKDIRFSRSKEYVNGYSIVRSSDNTDQPLVEQIVGFSEESAMKAIENLNHIARWERILEVTNPGSTINTNAVRMELYHAKEDRMIASDSGQYIFSYRSTDPPERQPQFRMKLVNTSHRRLYCSLLYMSSQFAINTQLFPGGGVWLESGQEAWVLSGQVIKGGISEALLEFGKKEVNEVFKLIVSTSEYKAYTLKQEELGVPQKASRKVNRIEHNTRSLFFSEDANGHIEDWNATTLTITMQIEN